MSNEIDVTVKGWLAWEPKLTETTRGIPQVKFRVGSTPRRRDAVTGQWNDGPTEWFDVIAYRDLAENAALSLRKGTPVVVRGRLEFRQWDRDGKPYSTNQIVADAIGVELSRGAATYRRMVTSNGERPGAVGVGRQCYNGSALVTISRRIAATLSMFLALATGRQRWEDAAMQRSGVHAAETARAFPLVTSP